MKMRGNERKRRFVGLEREKKWLQIEFLNF